MGERWWIKTGRTEHSVLYRFGEEAIKRIRKFGYEVLDIELKDDEVKFRVKAPKLTIDYVYTLKTITSEDGTDLPYAFSIRIDPHGIREESIASFLLGQIDNDQIFDEKGKLFKLRERAENAKKSLERVISENNLMVCRIKKMPGSKDIFFERLFEYMVRPSITFLLYNYSP